jgi:hypothetical protein
MDVNHVPLGLLQQGAAQWYGWPSLPCLVALASKAPLAWALVGKARERRAAPASARNPVRTRPGAWEVARSDMGGAVQVLGRRRAWLGEDERVDRRGGGWKGGGWMRGKELY